MPEKPKVLHLTADEWNEICEAVDYMAGGEETCARLWPDFMTLLGPGGTVVIEAEPQR